MKSLSCYKFRGWLCCFVGKSKALTHWQIAIALLGDGHFSFTCPLTLSQPSLVLPTTLTCPLPCPRGAAGFRAPVLALCAQFWILFLILIQLHISHLFSFSFSPASAPTFKAGNSPSKYDFIVHAREKARERKNGRQRERERIPSPGKVHSSVIPTSKPVFEALAHALSLPRFISLSLSLALVGGPHRRRVRRPPRTSRRRAEAAGRTCRSAPLCSVG